MKTKPEPPPRRHDWDYHTYFAEQLKAWKSTRGKHENRL